MTNDVSRKLEIIGTFTADRFAEWIVSRALRLSLSGWVIAHSRHRIEIHIIGDSTLVDAMEVACSLGPIDAIVDAIRTQSPSEFEQDLGSRHLGQFNRY